jgi:Domain of unknown function (DUF4134)
MWSKKKWGNTRFQRIVIATQLAMISTLAGYGQTTGDGVAGITKATDLVKSYYKVGTTLMYVLGAIIGLIGAVKVYNKWSSGDQDTSKAAASWFGACIFLVIVATVLESFFKIT